MQHKEQTESYRILGEMYCIADEMVEEGYEYKGCASSDAMSIYQNHYDDESEDFTATCFSCHQSFRQHHLAKSSHADELGLEVAEGTIKKKKKKFERKPKAEKITKEEFMRIMKHGSVGDGYRGLKDEYLEYFGHKIQWDDNNDKITCVYYPETLEGKINGFKTRLPPKNFKSPNIGITGIGNDLSGQSKYLNTHFRDIVIVGGEEDKVALHQIWMDYMKSKGLDDYEPMPIVSPVTGEGSALKQIQKHYDFINRAENIYIALDNDEAGHAAMAEICKILPKEKIKIIYWTMKDPNSFIYDNKTGKLVGKERQAIRDFYNAKNYVESEIKSSIDADLEMEHELMMEKVSLPSFMFNLQKMMAGGIPLGYIVNWVAETGIGKTTLINECIRHWVFNSPHKIGILSLELSAGQYMITMLSREVGKKIQLIEDPKEAIEFVRTPEVQKARKHLRETEDGEERFMILDERDGELDQVKIQVEKLINKHGCKVIVIDPVQDLLEGVSDKEQLSFIKWMKGVIKGGITIMCVCHVRKGNKSVDSDGKRITRQLTEDDVAGFSNLVKSGGANIFMMRDKYAEDVIRKNTTVVDMGKCRWTGITGNVDKWYYDNESHTMYGLRDYFTNVAPEKLPEGYDLNMPEPKKEYSKPKKGSLKKKEPEQDFVEMEDGTML